MQAQLLLVHAKSDKSSSDELSGTYVAKSFQKGYFYTRCPKGSPMHTSIYLWIIILHYGLDIGMKI